MFKYILLMAASHAAAVILGGNAYANETKTERAETIKNEALDSTKSAFRDAEDQICEMVNGTMKCVAKKIKHKAKTLSDKVKTKAKEEKNKYD
jgi:hypothetical protein